MKTKPRLTAIVLDPATGSVEFTRVHKLKDTKGGKVAWTTGNGASIVKNVFMRNRPFPFNIFAQKRYILLKAGEARPLAVMSDAKPLDYDAKMFQAAIESSIATKFLQGGRMDWKTLLIVFLGFLVATLIGIVAMMVSQIPVPVVP